MRRTLLSPGSRTTNQDSDLAETFIADADGTGGAVSVPTAELGASLSDVHVIVPSSASLFLRPSGSRNCVALKAEGIQEAFVAHGCVQPLVSGDRGYF